MKAGTHPPGSRRRVTVDCEANEHGYLYFDAHTHFAPADEVVSVEPLPDLPKVGDRVRHVFRGEHEYVISAERQRGDVPVHYGVIAPDGEADWYPADQLTVVARASYEPVQNGGAS